MNLLNPIEYQKIFNFHSSILGRIISRESSWLEFKESFNWKSKDKYGKSLAAFANNRGGLIVFGVKDKPRDLVGLQSGNFENIDESKISEYLNDIFSPEISFKKFVLDVKGKKVGILCVDQSSNKPIVCIKYDGSVKEAEIYYRYNARSEKIKYPELQNILNLIRERESAIWMEHLEKISKIGPSNAAVLDVLDGKIEGAGGTLVIDKKLVPKLKFITEGKFKETGHPTLKLIGDVKPAIVGLKDGGESKKIQVSNDPDAPLVQIQEKNLLDEYSLDYYQLRESLSKKYKNFIANQKFNKLLRDLKQDSNFCFKRVLDPKNPKSAKKYYYHPNILEEFGKHYE